MTTMPEIIAAVQAAKHEQRLRFAKEHLPRMFEHNVYPSQVREALNSGGMEIIPESLNHDPKNPSPACTFLGWDEGGRALHIIVAYRRMLVVTCYEPTPPWWVTPRQKGSKQ